MKEKLTQYKKLTINFVVENWNDEGVRSFTFGRRRSGNIGVEIENPINGEKGGMGFQIGEKGKIGSNWWSKAINDDEPMVVSENRSSVCAGKVKVWIEKRN